MDADQLILQYFAVLNEYPAKGNGIGNGVLMLELLQPIIVVLCMGVGYALGVIPTILLSLRSLEPGPFSRIGDFSYYRSKGMKWWHISYCEGEVRYLPGEGVALVGWALFVY